MPEDVQDQHSAKSNDEILALNRALRSGWHYRRSILWAVGLIIGGFITLVVAIAKAHMAEIHTGIETVRDEMRSHVATLKAEADANAKSSDNRIDANAKTNADRIKQNERRLDKHDDEMRKFSETVGEVRGDVKFIRGLLERKP